MKSRLLTVSLAVAAVLTALHLPAMAFTPGACREDEKKFCGDAKGEGRRDCMKKHEADMSPECKANMAEAKQKMEQKMADIKAACKDDLQKFCANVTPGEGRDMACLKSYSDKVSAACKEKLPQRGSHYGMKTHHDKTMGGPGHDHEGDEHGDAPPPQK